MSFVQQCRCAVIGSVSEYIATAAQYFTKGIAHGIAGAAESDIEHPGEWISPQNRACGGVSGIVFHPGDGLAIRGGGEALSSIASESYQCGACARSRTVSGLHHKTVSSGCREDIYASAAIASIIGLAAGDRFSVIKPIPYRPHHRNEADSVG